MTAAATLSPHIPIQHQLFILLRNEIKDGLWSGRSDFPGEVELAERFGVSVITSRRVLDRLVADRLIARGRGRRPQVIARTTAGQSFGNLNVGTKYKYEILSVGVGVGPGAACDVFDLPHGSELWQLKRLRSLGGRPHSVSHNAQLPAVGNRHPRKSLERLAMHKVFEMEHVPIVRLLRTVSVGLPAVDVAEALQISLQDPTLIYTCTLLGRDERPLEWVRIFVHPQAPAPVEVIDFDSQTWLANAP